MRFILFILLAIIYAIWRNRAVIRYRLRGIWESQKLQDIREAFFGRRFVMKNKVLDDEHVYFKCPKCKKRLRVPKGKGRISIHCPQCGNDFIKKT